MSDTLRYLQEDGSEVSGTAAREFLQGKLAERAKGRYTKEQIANLEGSGGYSVVNASDGAIPSGPAYDAQNPSKSQSSSSSSGGAMTPEEIRDKFGLKFDKKHAEMSGKKFSRSTGGDGYANKNGAIFTESGEYVGSVKGDGDEDYYAGYSDLTDAASSIKQEHEGKGFSSVDSLSDVAGAVHWLTKGKKEEAKTEETGNKPIEHSPEIKQSVDRIRTYEDDVMSGKMSDDIFGGQSETNQYTLDEGKDYTFESNQGIGGIGTPGGIASDDSATKASANFLDAKKTDIKKQYNFQPA